jgi:hypothetical protein
MAEADALALAAIARRDLQAARAMTDATVFHRFEVLGQLWNKLARHRVPVALFLYPPARWRSGATG